MLAKLSFAAAVFGAVAFSVANAAPLAPQSGVDTGDGTVSLVKKGGSKPGKSKNGAGKSGKHGKHHHRHRRGGGIYIETGFCALTAASCAERYGSRTRRYYRCMDNAGC